MDNFESIPKNNIEISEHDRDMLTKYEKLLSYAKSQTSFVRVYRAEGDKSKSHLSQISPTLAGTWFTPTYSNAVSYKESYARADSDVKIISVVIPQSVLDERETIDKGMNQINVLSPELLQGAIITENEIVSEPNINDYLRQFAFVEELKQKGLI